MKSFHGFGSKLNWDQYKKELKIRLMNSLVKFISYLNTLPACFKGLKKGKNSYIGPGYDLLFVSFNGIELRNNVLIGKNAWLQTIPNDGKKTLIFINNGTQIGRNFTASAIKKIIIGKKCLLSYNVSIFDHDHDFTNPKVAPMDAQLSVGKPVIINDGCFIGAHSFILKGVHLGKHCIVGANSVVTKSFAAYSIIAGNPAKLIRRRK